MTESRQERSSEAGAFYPPGPGPRDRDPSALTQLRLALRSSIEAWPRAVYEERTYTPPIPGMPILLMDPDLVRAVLVEETDSFPQGALFQRMLGPVWGRGLATAEAADWRFQRRAAAPSFRPAGLGALTPWMRAAAEAALARWASMPDGPIDVAEEAARITFDVILDTMLSGGEDLDRTTARGRVSSFMAQISSLRPSYYLAPDGYHRHRRAAETEASRQLRADLDRMIARRRKAPPRGDLLDLLMTAADPETGRAMDDATLRDNLLGFIVAGHETTATGLAWALYLVSQHAPTAARLRAEVDAVTGGDPVGPEHLDRLVFVRQVVAEALRLYPPAHSLTRVCTRTTRIGELTIRAGRRIIVPVYALHRHRRWWRDPDRFDPDRFAPGEPPPSRHVYLPFGAGPRICIGAALATTELVVTLATLVRAADFRMAPGHDVWPVATLGLNPRGGLPMMIAVRSRERPRIQDPVG